MDNTQQASVGLWIKTQNAKTMSKPEASLAFGNIRVHGNRYRHVDIHTRFVLQKLLPAHGLKVIAP